MSAPIVAVSDLTFTYPRTRDPSVVGLTFDVDDGEVFGFLGPSGAGKSTTQKVLIGLLRGWRGEASVLGEDVRAFGPDLYEDVGVSFEVPNLYLKLTALENLRYFRALYSSDTEDPHELLERVGLAQDAGLRVSQFSRGMKVRLGFARSLLSRPRLLFLDEPTAGLDPVNAQNIKQIIKELAADGRTVFLTTHDMSVADQLCDRVAFIVDGALACVDSPRSLKLRHGQRSVRVEYGADGAVTSREFPIDGLGKNADFLALLRESEIETIHTQETSLEGVFIEVTGRGLS